MRLQPSDEIFSQVPGDFLSLWPSNDSLVDQKIQAMRESKFGVQQLLENASQSAYNAMRIALMRKATKVGDFLTSQLKAAASWKATPTGRALQGVFANVGFSNLTDVRDCFGSAGMGHTPAW